MPEKEGHEVVVLFIHGDVYRLYIGLCTYSLAVSSVYSGCAPPEVFKVTVKRWHEV